jgi:hypothetical protein
MAVACGRSPDASSHDLVSFTGRILDFSSGTDVPSALVEIGGANARSDSSGRYTLTVPTGHHSEAHVEGNWAGNVFVTGARYRGDFLVNAAILRAEAGVDVLADHLANWR